MLSDAQMECLVERRALVTWSRARPAEFKAGSGAPMRSSWNRELNLRLEERLRERARIARELHDTLFQGFLGASLQLHYAVDQVPADSPSKPSLCRALRLMQRVIDEGRDASEGLRSSATASMSLEQALSGVRDEFTPGGDVGFRIFVTGTAEVTEAGGPGADLSDRAGSTGQRTAPFRSHQHRSRGGVSAPPVARGRARQRLRDGSASSAVGTGAHWGLLGMRERAESIGAQLRIWSRPKAGTEVEISVPGHIMADACA